jgi:hypothetical protein
VGVCLSEEGLGLTGILAGEGVCARFGAGRHMVAATRVKLDGVARTQNRLMAENGQCIAPDPSRPLALALRDVSPGDVGVVECGGGRT